MEGIFELAAELNLGEVVDADDINQLLSAEAPIEKFWVVDIAAAHFEELDAASLLAESQTTYVGLAIVRTNTPEWLFWCPQSYPIEERRLLFLPPWKSAVHSMPAKA